MDRHIAASGASALTPDWSTTDWTALGRFAVALRERLGATRVLLFGSRARGTQRRYSDYDLILVSPWFAAVPLLERGRGVRHIWYGVGGDGPMDLICVTPEEFEADRQRASLIQAVLPEACDLLERPWPTDAVADTDGRQQVPRGMGGDGR